jgi:peptidoglycan/LPS O-acetylase OafA/YrhL
LPRLACLDGLRGVLAAYVMTSHMAPFAVMPAWLAGLLSHGGAGVDAFFVLSGMVIMQSLRAHGFRRRRFLAARAWRIFPVFLLVFAVAIGVQSLDPPAAAGHFWDTMPWIPPDGAARAIWAIGTPRDWRAAILAHLTMTHGLFPDAMLPDIWVSYLGAAWSLSTEWQFYLLAALCVPLLRREHIGLPAFAGLLLSLAAAGAAWQALAPDGWTFSRAFLPNKAAYFALGVASAALLQTPPEAIAGRGATFAAVLAATLLLCLLQGADKLGVPIFWAVCLAAQIRPLQTGTGWLAWVLTRPELLFLGAVSYPLYLVNEPAQKLMGTWLAVAAQGDGGWFSAFWVPGAVLLPVGLAWLLHIGIERPAMRRFRRPGGRVAPRPADSLCAAPGWTSRTHPSKSRIPLSRSRTG